MATAQHSRPLWIGSLTASTFVPVLMTLLTAFSSYSVMIPPLLVFIMGVVIATPVAFFVALPLAVWLRGRGQLNALYLCLAGTLAGAIILGIYSLQSNYWPQMNDKEFARWIAQQAAIKSLVPGGIYGFLSATAFSIGAGLTIRPRKRRMGGA